MGHERTRDEGRSRLIGATRARRRPAAQPPRGGSPARDSVTVEQLVARQGGEVGRRRAARTGEVPIPLAPGEQPPAHRRGLPPVPGAAGPASGPHPAQPPSGPPAPPPTDSGVVSRGLPPVPGAAPTGGPERPADAVPARAGLPAVPPSARASVPLFPPLGAEQPGHRPSRPVAPLPPIPGRDLPPSGATRLTPPGPRERRAARRASRSPARRHLVRAASALLVLVGVVVTYHLGLYFYVDQGMRRVAALAPAGPEVLAPQLQAGAQTYLVVGTGLPGAAGPAAVTALIAHVPADQDSAVLVSLPPAALVDTPACVQEDGDLREPATEAVATALLDGGPACLVRVVQQLSGLRVDHYLGVDLARVPGLVDALGGISLCLPTPSGADGVAASPLPAGTSELTGEQAAGYLRPGDAVDATGAAVAQRTQILLTATLDAAVSVDTLRDPVALTRFSVRASDALTVDQDTNLGDLRTLGDTLGDLGGDAVQRTELPVSRVDHVPAGEEQPVVVLDGGATRTLFETVIDSGRLPAELAAPPADAAAPAPAAEPAPGTAAPAPEPAPGAPTVPPGQVTVDVLNATATGGLAATAAEQLRTQGFVVGAVGNEPGAVAGTLVRYAPEAAEQARTVAAAVPGATLQEGVPAGSAVQLVLGPGYAGVVPVTVAPPPVAEPGPEAAAAAPETSPAASTEPVRC